MGCAILKLHDIYVPEQPSCGPVTAVWRPQNMTQYFPLLGFVEEVLKSLALLSFSEKLRGTQCLEKSGFPKLQG